MQCEICKSPVHTGGMTRGKYDFCPDCMEYADRINCGKSIPQFIRKAILARVAASREAKREMSN